jgi:hypothetical protein
MAGTAMCRHSFPSTQAVGQETYGREKLQILFTNLYTVIELPVLHRFCFSLVNELYHEIEMGCGGIDGERIIGDESLTALVASDF